MDTEVINLALPTTIGTGYGGGFYAGQFRIGNALFALFVAPKAEGEHPDTKWHKSVKKVAGALSFCDGLANTAAMAEAGSELATWARGLRIAGFDDWYVPSRDELELLYRHFKPTDESNWVYRNGDNPSSIPPGYPYTDGSPAKTAVAGFAKGGAEAFDPVWYWTSTQSASGSDSAWYQGFYSGCQDDLHKSNELRARAVRRLPL